jgi:hypothetical protein
MHQKYSTTFFSQRNELVVQPANKTKFYLRFVILFVGVVAGNHAVIAQTVIANRDEHRPLDRMLVTHQHPTTQESGNSKNFNLPNSLIAGNESQADLIEYHDKHHSGKPTIGEQHLIMPKLHVDDGSGGTKNVRGQIPMSKPRIGDGSRDWKNPSKTAPKH